MSDVRGASAVSRLHASLRSFYLSGNNILPHAFILSVALARVRASTPYSMCGGSATLPCQLQMAWSCHAEPHEAHQGTIRVRHALDEIVRLLVQA